MQSYSSILVVIIIVLLIIVAGQWLNAHPQAFAQLPKYSNVAAPIYSNTSSNNYATSNSSYTTQRYNTNTNDAMYYESTPVAHSNKVYSYYSIPTRATYQASVNQYNQGGCYISSYDYNGSPIYACY